MRAALARHGHRVHIARDAESGLKAFRKHRPDAVLLDLVLPGVGGLEFLRQIRSESQVPVVLVSGRISSENRARGLKFGAHDFLHKPFTIPHLLSSVDRALAFAAH